MSLAEISAVLSAYPGVRRAEAAVVRLGGGDSLSALGVIAAIEAEFGRSLDVYEFMAAASVRGLAEILR
jgi:acyl carrier protein